MDQACRPVEKWASVDSTKMFSLRPRERFSAVPIVGFCDASNMAYAAMVYLGDEGEHGMSLSLMVAKTRVAPIKSQTIPRLELLSALLLA